MVVHFLTPFRYSNKICSFFILSVPEFISHRSFIPLISEKKKNNFISPSLVNLVWCNILNNSYRKCSVSLGWKCSVLQMATPSFCFSPQGDSHVTGRAGLCEFWALGTGWVALSHVVPAKLSLSSGCHSLCKHLQLRCVPGAIHSLPLSGPAWSLWVFPGSPASQSSLHSAWPQFTIQSPRWGHFTPHPGGAPGASSLWQLWGKWALLGSTHIRSRSGASHSHPISLPNHKALSVYTRGALWLASSQHLEQDMGQSPWASSVPINWYNISCPLGGSKEQMERLEHRQSSHRPIKHGLRREWCFFISVVIYTFVLAPPRTKPDGRDGGPSPLWDGAHLGPDVLNGRGYRSLWSLPRQWSGS